jgi:hypothetical protein
MQKSQSWMFRLLALAIVLTFPAGVFAQSNPSAPANPAPAAQTQAPASDTKSETNGKAHHKHHRKHNKSSDKPQTTTETKPSGQ